MLHPFSKTVSLKIVQSCYKHAVLLAIAALSIVAISPVWLISVPAISDFFNHLARMYVLVADGTADANPYYQVRLALYPNLAMDLIVPSLAHFMNVLLAAKIFLMICQLLIITGAMAIEYVVKRKHEFAGFI